ncbi:hypothetical protein [Albidovulum sp.]|uniref:hypothetical protein n=1 Tax=Albidovulum sp. TaxID=1872424 RepID=UPI0039B8BA19
MTAKGQGAARQAGGAAVLALIAGLAGMAGWGLLVAAGVASLAPVLGLAPAFAAAAALHLLAALAAGLRLRSAIRAAAERRRARLASFTLLRALVTVLPRDRRRRPALRHAVAMILGLIALGLVLAPPGERKPPGGEGSDGGAA